MAAIFTPAALPSSMIGQVYYLAAVAGPIGSNFNDSSLAVSVELVP